MRRLVLLVVAGAAVLPAQVSAAVRHAVPGGARSSCSAEPADANVERDPGSAPSAAPPRVRQASPTATVGIIGVAGGAAMLTGAVDPGGLATTYRFEYGPTAACGSFTSAVTVPARGATTRVAAGVSDLVAGTTYHVRLVATNACGSSVSSVATFVTTSRPALATASRRAPAAPRAADASGATSPALTGVTVSPTRGRAGRAVRLRMQLDRDATVTIGLEQVAVGDGRATRGARTVPVRSVTRDVQAGSRSLPLPRSFVPRAPGRYRITIRAEADGRRSRTTTRALTITG